MKTVEELHEYYRTELIKVLQPLEQKRKQVLNQIVIASVVIGVVAIVIGALIGGGTGNPVGFLIPVIIGGVLIALAAKFLSSGYVIDFKLSVIHPMVKFLDENLDYKPKDFIPRSVFMMSRIFTTKPNVYKGDDLVTGKIGATSLRFSELNAVYESGSGKNKHRTTVFKGLFFVADFNKHFKSKTIVLPDTAEKLFGGLGKLVQGMNFFRGKLIKLEDPEFEQYFVVYGDDQIEARYILSPSLMARIVDFKKKTGCKVYLSFVGSMVFVAIWINRNMFEPKICSTLLDFVPIRQYYEDLQLAVGIVEDLNLNTRIWSKQ